MGTPNVRTKTLQRAALAIGGEERLAEVLDVPPEQASRWMSGQDYPPTNVYHQALDLLVGIGAH